MAQKLGQEEKFYVKAPPAPADPKVVGNYTLLAAVTTNNISGSSQEVDGASKDTAGFASIIIGRKDISINIGYNQDLAGNAAQNLVEDAYLATTAAGQQLYWLLTTNVTADRGRHGLGVVSSYEYNSDDATLITVTATIRNQGAYTTFTVP